MNARWVKHILADRFLFSRYSIYFTSYPKPDYLTNVRRRCSMNYWLDLFTGTTWDEFRKAGSNISGFSQRRHRVIDKIKPGDIFLCYLTGVMRWVGALEVIGPTADSSP